MSIDEEIMALARAKREAQTVLNESKTAGDEIDSNGDIIPKSTAITYIPSPLKEHIQAIADISITQDDTVAVACLTALCGLTNGATISDNRDGGGDSIIIYGAAFMPSESGKSTAILNARRYFTKWRQSELQEQNESIHKERQAIEAELKSAKQTDKKELIARLNSLMYRGDAYYDGGTVEGLEQSLSEGSSLSCFIDEFGKYYQQKDRNAQIGAVLRALQIGFDSGYFNGMRTKGGSFAKTYPIRGLGLYLASTIGNSNLSPKAMSELFADGFLNRCLVTFEDKLKPIPRAKDLSFFDAVAVENFSKRFYMYANNTAFYLNTSANDYLQDVIADTNTKRAKGIVDKGMGDLRVQKVAKRIATIYHLATHCDSHITVNEINRQTLENAFEFVRNISEKHHTRIDSYIGTEAKPDPLDRLVKAIRDGKDTVRDIQQSLRLPAPVIKGMVDTAINQHLVFIDSNGRLTA
jgi:Protein of unknown function (DUF3987)